MRRSERRRVVLVCDEAPGFQRAGQNVVIRDFLRFFAEHDLEVHLIVTSSKLGFVLTRPETLPFQLHSPHAVAGRYLRARGLADIVYNLGWTLFPRFPQPVQAAAARVRDIIRGLRQVDFVVGSFLNDSRSAEVYDLIRRLDPEFIFYSSIFVVPWAKHAGTADQAERLSPLRGFSERSFIITHDVMHQRCAAFRQRGYRIVPGDLDAVKEAAILRSVRHIIAINDTDRAAFEAILPGSRPLVVTTTIDVQDTVRDRVVDPGKCVYIASGSLHNVIGLRWFLDACWPAIHAERPDARLHVYGTVGSRLTVNQPNVHLEGVVDDLAEVYRDAAVCVVPLTLGSGLKIKLVEAMGYGVAIVTTSVGAQGLMHLEPRPFVVADEADAFARSVSRLLEQSAARCQLEDHARAVAPLFSLPAVFAPVADAMFGRSTREPGEHRAAHHEPNVSVARAGSGASVPQLRCGEAHLQD